MALEISCKGITKARARFNPYARRTLTFLYDSERADDTKICITVAERDFYMSREEARWLAEQVRELDEKV